MLSFELAGGELAVEAFLAGLEQRKAAGGSLVGIESVASFFISRVDTEVDKRLDAMPGDAKRLRGQAAVANSRLAYEVYEGMLGSPRWQALAAKGA